MLPTDPNGSFRFSSPRGWQICRKILTDRLPFGPHDYQLEEITQALDGQDVVAVSATGSGKSAYIYMLAILLLELAKDPSLSPMKKKIPADPAVVVVCPTTALEDDLEGKMRGYGLSVKAINAKSVHCWKRTILRCAESQ